MLDKIIHKFKIAVYSITALSVLALSACKKNNLAVDVDPLTPPTAAEFVFQTAPTAPLAYYVQSSGAPYKIPVGLTSVSGQDRTVNFVATSNTATAGVQYTAPAPLVIKAGKAVDTLNFAALFAGYAGGRKDTVKIKFSGINTVYTKDSVLLIIQQYCDVIPATLFSGSYTKCVDKYGSSSYGYYTSTIPTYTAGSTSTSGTIYIKNLGVAFWGPFTSTDPVLATGIMMTVDWSNPAAFSITIPSQNYFDDGSGSAPSTIKGTGTFSSCNNTLTINATVHYAGDGNNYATTFTLAR